MPFSQASSFLLRPAFSQVEPFSLGGQVRCLSVFNNVVFHVFMSANISPDKKFYQQTPARITGISEAKQ